MALRFSYQPGAGVSVELTGGADRAPRADRRLRPARAAGAAARHRLPLRADPAPHRRRAATSSSTTSTRTGGLVPVDRPPGLEPGRASWSGSSAPRPRSTRRASCASRSSATPRSSLGSVVRARVQPHHRGDRPRRARSACRWSGSRSRPGRRSRARAAPRTWTGSPGCCAASSRSPRRGARSTSSSPASTSARSRTGTPRRRCCMHTRGILVMTPDSAMVLTGKQALDYSGGVSAEDNFGIGGFDRIMGPNGQAQYWAPHLAGACEVLLAHYAHSYVAPGERFPRRAETSRPDRSRRARLAALGPRGPPSRRWERSSRADDEPRAQEGRSTSGR